MRGLRAATPYLILAAATAAAAWFSLHSYPLVPDETDILAPAISLASGKGWQAGKYPDFPYLFYGVIFRLAFFFGLKGQGLLFALARLSNLGLFACSGLLFLACSRRYLDGAWRSLALALFLSSPVVLFSGVYVKSESILLCGVLLAFFFAQKCLDRPRALWPAVACGIATAVCLATKYNIFAVLFFAAALVTSRRSRALPGQALLRPALCFIAAFLLSAVFFWPGVFLVFAERAALSGDLYFSDLPSPFRAVDGFFSFPYGRLANPLLVIAPVSLGIFQYLAGLIGFFSASLKKGFPALALPFFLCHLAAMILATANQFPWLFSPLAPFLALGAAGLLARLPRRVLPAALSAALALSLYQAPAVLQLVGNVQGALVRAHRDARQEGKADLIILVNSALTRRADLDSRALDREVAARRPRFILAYDAYTENFCKNAGDPDYERQCAFLRALGSGRAGYRILWSKESEFALQCLFPFAEKKARFIFLETDTGGSHEKASP